MKAIAHPKIFHPGKLDNQYVHNEKNYKVQENLLVMFNNYLYTLLREITSKRKTLSDE